MAEGAILILSLDDLGACSPAEAAEAAVVVLLDLRDADQPAAVEAARKARAFDRPLWIGVGALDDDRLEARLAALAPLEPDAFVLSEVSSAADVQHLGAMLAVHEAEAALADGALRIVACIESAPALFELSAIAKASARLAALMWDGEAFARDLDAEEARGSDGRWTDPLQTVRTLLLAACADAKLPAIDSAFTAASDLAFQSETEAARRDGFSAKVALDAQQASVVRSVFASRNG